METKKGSHEFIAWSDKYGVCDGELDTDHKDFVDLLNSLSDAVNKGEATDVFIQGIFDDLTQHMEKHFEAEELFMQKHQYPLIDQHKSEHEQFRRSILILMDEFSKVSVKITDKLTRYLHAWLIGHMIGSDKDYADYIKSKGIKSDVSEDRID